MAPPRRIAVLGLYNSGSTVVARVLHRLGVNMGAPFWADPAEGGAQNYYEPQHLAWRLRRWWNEPHAVETVPEPERVRFLERWALLLEAEGGGPVGAKHPLLSLSPGDLLQAWGPDTVLVWAWRPLPASVDGLKRRGWFAGKEEGLQQRLWDALHAFAGAHAGVTRLEYDRIRSEPGWAASTLAALAGLTPPAARLQSAAACVRPPSGPPGA